MPKELERTFLIKRMPEDLKNFPSKEVFDIYIPKSYHHPILRIRKNGEKFEMTKKSPVRQGDSSIQIEQTIILNKDEFEILSKLDAKPVRKIRYYYPYKGRTVELDIFQDTLRGLVLADVEFETEEEKGAFEMPEFCLADVTQETFLAGGMLCGKSYSDIENRLKKFNYSKIIFQ